MKHPLRSAHFNIDFDIQKQLQWRKTDALLAEEKVLNYWTNRMTIIPLHKQQNQQNTTPADG